MSSTRIGQSGYRAEMDDAERASRDEIIALQTKRMAWSLVHGFTMLLLDGSLSDILHRLPEGTSAEILLEAMMRAAMGRPPGPQVDAAPARA